jgi:hypothetical protein
VTFSLGLFSHYPIAASVLILLLIIGVVITSYFASQRLKHKKSRLSIVLAANTVAALTVVGLAFDIKIISDQPTVVYLVTNGATVPHLEQINAQQLIFVMRDAAKSEALKPNIDGHILDTATQIDVPSQILSHQATFDSLHVFGDGLSLSQWKDLQLLMGEEFRNISVTFSASKPRIGLVNMQWSREMTVGQFVEIKGQLQGTGDPGSADNIYKLKLLDPVGQIVETIRLKASERFTLSFPAKSTGQWVYRLQLSRQHEINLLADEPIAFSVAKPAPLRIMIKQSAPSFETRQLKNWAAQFGSQISILTQISQNKDIRQDINLSAGELKQITLPFTEQALVNFDWLLIDGRALLTLTVRQMAALQTAIKNGLGVYIITDNELANAWPIPSLDWLGHINIQPLDVANYSALPNWPHSKIEQAMPLVRASITSVSGASLVQNNNAQILVSHNKIGLGQVAVSLINSTYGWQTSGLTAQYSHYWQSVIYGLARPKQTPYWVHAKPDTLTLVNQSVQRCLLGADDSGVATHNQNPHPLILTQDLLETEQRCLTIWLTNERWHKLAWSENTGSDNIKKDQIQLEYTWLYANTEQDWREWQQLQNRMIGQKIVQQQSIKQFKKTSMQSLNKSWFWGLFVFSISLLWLERKLF